jgi:aminopeptidase N
MALRRRAVALVTVLVAMVAPPAAAAGDAQPSPGAAGLGDRLFPALGNGGYDVLHYDLTLRYETADPGASPGGTIRVVSKATQALSRFNLDFGGTGVADVFVNGREATWTRSGEELVVTPSRPVREGEVFSTRVRGFTAGGLFRTPDGSAAAAQPDRAHDTYPSNDHPRDKARFTFRLDVPAGTTAVANGVLVDRDVRDGRWIWRYRQRQPMATELTQLAVGAFAVTTRGTQDGVLLRDVTPRRLTASLDPQLATVTGHLPWMRERVGEYPFDAYGSLVIDQPIGFALETQTLSIFDTGWFAAGRAVWEPTMIHELAHQWFGNSVSPWEWSDLWLNEGHATWYHLLYAAERGLLEEGAGEPTLEAFMRSLYSAGDEFRAQWGPVARPLSGSFDELFSPQVYEGGALALYALRQEIGREAFAALQRRWVQRFRGRSVSTLDFIALASEVAGRDLTAFLRAWLYGTRTPPMPGHPDWTVEPPAPLPAAAP